MKNSSTSNSVKATLRILLLIMPIMLCIPASSQQQLSGSVTDRNNFFGQLQTNKTLNNGKGNKSVTGVINIPGYFEAEDYSSMSGILVLTTTDIIAPNYYIGYIDDGDWVEYPISVTTAGEYTLFIRGASVNDNSHIKVFVDNIQQLDIPVFNTGEWDYFVTYLSENKLTLSQGNHTLKFEFHTGSPYVVNVNYFDIENILDQSVDVPGLIEAESFNDAKGIAIGYYQGSSTIEGYIGWTNDNDWVEYNLNVLQAGTYQFQFRVTAPDPGGVIQVWNNDQLKDEVTIVGTSGWDDYTILNTEFETSAGLNMFCLVFKGPMDFICSVENINVKLLSATPNPDLIEKENVEIYPNPTHDLVWIDLPFEIAEYTLEIYNGTGNRLTRVKMKKGNAVDLTPYPAGTYFLTFKTNNQCAVYKIIKR